MSHGFGENFGTKKEPYQHAGEDWIFVKDDQNKTVGARLFAKYSGEVEEVRFDERLGNVIRIKTDDGGQNNEFHLSTTLVKKGQRITEGELIGLAGDSGSTCKGAHEHREIRYSSLPKEVRKSESINRYDRFYLDPR